MAEQWGYMRPFPIQIDDTDYFIDIGSWRGKDIIDFSPRASVPGGGLVYSDLSMYQPIAQTNFQHGFGFIWHVDEAGYLQTQGLIDTRHKDAVMLFTEETSSDTDANTKHGGINFNSKFFAWGDGGVRKYESAAWSDVNILGPYPGPSIENSGTGIADAGTLTLSSLNVNENVAHKQAIVIAFGHDGANCTGWSATCGGSAMTEVVDSNTSVRSHFIAYLNDPSDTDDIVITISMSSGTMDVVAIAFTVYDSDESAPAYTQESQASGVTSISNSISGITSHDLIVSAIYVEQDEADDTYSWSSGVTALAADDTGTDESLHVGYQYQDDSSDAQTHGLTWANSVFARHLSLVFDATSEVKVNHMIENGTYVFAFPDGKRVRKSTDGDTWTPAGNNVRSIDYSTAIIHDGYLWAVKDDDPTLYFDSNEDLSDLQGDPADDTDEIVVGIGNDEVLSIASFLEKLSVGKAPGLWTVDQDETTTAKTTLDFAKEKSSNNFRDMAVHGGNLYFPLQDKLYQWNGSRLTDITPEFITDEWPYEAYGRFDNFMPHKDWLFYTARTNASTYNESIIAFDGVGVHRMDSPITDGDGSITMLVFDDVNNYIWYHVSKPTAGTETTYYIPVNDDDDLPFSNFPTSGTHQLETSRIHAGFRRINKSSTQLIVYTDNCDAGTYITVHYKLDGASSWSKWADIQANGETVLDLPTGDRSIEFNYIELAFQFVTDDATQTPVLEGVVLQVLMRPDVRYGYSFDIMAENNMQSGMMEDLRTVKQVKDDIRSARNSKSPILLKSPFGESIWGYITSLTESAVEYEPENDVGGIPAILMVMRVNFAETLEVEGETSRSIDRDE